MKKENVYKILYAGAAVLALAFVVFFAIDAFAYDPIANSAPLSAYALIRALEFLLPSAIVFAAAIILKKKWSDKK